MVTDCDIAYRLKLYYGLSHDGQGRRDYLQTRVHIPPEDRYSLALLSSWQYGWQIAHKEELFDLPAHRRTSRIQESFFARNGVPKLHHDHPEIPTLIKETTHWSVTASLPHVSTSLTITVNRASCISNTICNFVFDFEHLRDGQTLYSVSQKITLQFSNIFPKRMGIFNQSLHTYYTFLSTLDYKFLFNYLKLWRSYAILSATT